jgi:hypothetical protein
LASMSPNLLSLADGLDDRLSGRIPHGFDARSIPTIWPQAAEIEAGPKRTEIPLLNGWFGRYLRAASSEIFLKCDLIFVEAPLFLVLHPKSLFHSDLNPESSTEPFQSSASSTS